MENKKIARVSAIITAVMLFLQLGTMLTNNVLLSVLQISSTVRLPDYLPMQIALIATAVLSIVGFLVGRKNEILEERESAGSLVMPILTIVFTVGWASIRTVIGIIRSIMIRRLEGGIRVGSATLGEISATQTYLGLLVDLCDFIFGICVLVLFVVAFFKAKKRAVALRAEFSKLATGVIIMIYSFFNTTMLITNFMFAGTNGTEGVAMAQTILSATALIVLSIVILALAIVALLLGLIPKEEKESV